jgi:hypothetical protein
MRILSKLFIAASFITVFVNSVSSQETVNTQQVSSFMYVVAGDGLNLRAEPTTQSEVIRILPFLTKLKIIEKSDSFITISGISSQWYKVSIDNDVGWVFGGYLSNNIDIPKVNNKSFITVYRINDIIIGANSFGYENIVKRLKKSYLVIYEKTGNERYIYDDEGLIEEIPHFGDGTRGSDIVVTGIYKYPWSPTEDNRELTEKILITFQSWRANQNNEKIYDYNILVTYERVLIE